MLAGEVVGEEVEGSLPWIVSWLPSGRARIQKGPRVVRLPKSGEARTIVKATSHPSRGLQQFTKHFYTNEYL